MRKKLLLKYVLIGLPFAFGSIMFSLGIYNITSSLLFFIGGYIFTKNIFDYRKINKNKKLIVNNQQEFIKKEKVYRSSENIPMLKRTRVHHKVRKRIKNIDF